MNNFQRAPKVHKVDTWIKPDGLDYCIECWKYFMGGTGGGSLYARPMGGMTANEDGYGLDIHEEQLAHDSKIGAATDAMIESLKPRYKWAIYKTCGVGQVIQFPFADLLQVYEEATESLRELLKNNFDTSYLF